MKNPENHFNWLTDLVAFDTTSCNSNLELIHFISNWLSAREINVRLTPDASGKKANLFATIPAHDGTTTGGLLLSGHTDVVPVAGQAWDTNPFIATPVKNRIYGRGTCDMKGFIAVALALIPQLQKRRLVKPLHLAFSYDEEVGCKGAPLIIADIQKCGIQPDACIVGEPTAMLPVVAHKGIHVFRCRVHGNAIHSSLTHKGCNAIEYAAQLICWIRQLANKMRQQGPLDECYDAPFTSISTNQIYGGNAMNTVPASCEFFFEFRNLPAISPKDILHQIEAYIQNNVLPEMRTEHATASIEIDKIAAAPSFEASEDEVITQLARALTTTQDVHKVAYGTEAGLFQQAGIPTIVCGPGNIEQAHRPNEFILMEQMNQCAEFLMHLIKRFLM